jgi:hypothetical protein
MPTSVDSAADLSPGDFYEDCHYHPCLCTEVLVDGDISISGISLVNGSHPRGCSIPGCDVRKLSLEEALHWRFHGPSDATLPVEKQWWRLDYQHTYP